jgi:hypothetical protein
LTRASTIEEQLEDEQEQAVIQGLIAAHQCTVDQLEILENEAEAQNAEQDDSIPEARSSEVEVMQTRTGNRETVISDGSAQKRATESKRASVWVSNLIFNNSPLPSGFRRNTWGDTISAPTIASQARYLVQAWTARAPKILKDSNQDQKKNSEPAIEDSEEERGDKSEPPPKPLVQPQNFTKPPYLFYVKAMHDYEADDRTSLSFHKGDIIQVLGMLESGWWDGVINGIRGWFPYNYTIIINPPHQDLETSHDEMAYEESDDDEIDYEDYYDEGSDDEEFDDFWIPQTPDGRLFYFNTQTGETSMKPPKKAEMVADTQKQLDSPANFWIPQSTPDGRLFYFNTQTGESAMQPKEESPKIVANVPSKRTDNTRNSGIDELKANSSTSKIPIGWC